MLIWYEQDTYWINFDLQHHKKKLINFIHSNLTIPENINKNIYNYFLLNESKFTYYHFTIQINISHKFNIQLYQKILTEKIQEIQNKYSERGLLINSEIINIYQQNETKQFIYGLTGEIKFDLNIIYLNCNVVDTLKITIGNTFIHNKKIIILPQSYYTVKYLTQFNLITDFNLLYIGYEQVKLLHIQNGNYYKEKYINLGIEELKKIFQENDVLSLFYKSFQGKEFNDFTLKLINQTCEFYSNMLIKWLLDNIDQSRKIIIISNLIKNKYFIDNFMFQFNAKSNGFILPFGYPEKIEYYNNKWQLNEVDIVLALNLIGKKNNVNKKND